MIICGHIIIKILEMKKILLLILIVGFNFNIKAQSCNYVVSVPEFQVHYNQISVLQNETIKLSRASGFLNGRCLTSAQVKQIALLFQTDAHRLPYAHLAYFSAYDKQIFFDVYDAFTNRSAAFRLDHYIYDTPPAPLPPLPVQSQSWYPQNLSYPSCNNYNGKTGCGLPMADVDFEVLVKPVLNQQSDAAVMTASKSFMQNKCLSMAQVMKLATLPQLEVNRLGFLKDALPRTYDMENYYYAAEIFSHGPYKNEWLDYGASLCKKQVVLAPPPPPPCLVAPADLNTYIKSIEKEMSSDNKLMVAKQTIRAGKCFKVSQLKQMVELMSFESAKLELAKYAYDFCTEKPNYFQMNDAFSFSSSKAELNNYINSKH